MERVSDEWIDESIEALEAIAKAEMRGPYEQLMALTELRDRRQASEAPCPEHAKMVAEWDIQGGEI